MIPLLLASLLSLGASGTARCDAARRDAIKAAEAAWMQEAPAPTSFIVGTPCSCGECSTTLEIRPLEWGPKPQPAAYYECKLREAQAREAESAKAEQRRRELEALVDAAKEAMYRVRDACGEGPKRPR